MTVAYALLLASWTAAANAPLPRLTLPPRPAAAAKAPSLSAAPPAAVYERKQVGLLVVDVKDSTPMHLTEGNRKAHNLIAGTLDFTEDSAALFDGVVIRRLGDGQLIAFPTLGQALNAAVSIQRHMDGWRRLQRFPSLQLRAAVHTGRVLFDQEQQSPEVFGRAVERVLQLSSISQGSDIAIDESLVPMPIVQDALRDAAHSRSKDAVLLRPLSAGPQPEGPGLQPRLAVTRMTVASTMFASLADWSDSYERHGRRPAFATVKAFHAYARGIVKRHGGLWVKTEGETVMASFSRPEAAAAAAEELQRRIEEFRRAAPLGSLAQARVGVSYGRVLREDRLEGVDFFGNTVNAAARLMKLALPGEVVLSGSLIDQLPAGARQRAAARESVSLKGFNTMVSLLRLKPKPVQPRPRHVRRLRRLAQEAQSRVLAP